MKPFDLSAALAGAPVQTRGGRPVTQLMKFEDVKGYPIYGVVEGCVFGWTATGTSGDAFSLDWDLFMAPAKKTGWVARNKCHAVIMLCSSEEECRQWYPNALSYHQIEWEE